MVGWVKIFLLFIIIFQREVVFVNVGQAGVQIANAIWELFCIEHSIGSDGLPIRHNNYSESDAFRTVFHEIPNGQYVPRVVSVDLEPTVLGLFYSTLACGN